jgi:stage IV sporulation protein FB
MRSPGRHNWDPSGEPGSGGGRFGGWSRVFRRLVDNPENPLGWSFFMFRVAGIDVRIHLFTVVYLLLLPLSALSPNSGGIQFIFSLLIALFVVVLLHEFGHCIACRLVRGEADRIVLLPFGGLALCQPPHTWKANLITTIGGPAVNVLLIPLTAGLMWLAGLGSHIVFNPLHPYAPFTDGSVHFGGVPGVLLRSGAWWLHYTNVVVLGFNLLLAMYPFDAGRIVHALMWKRMGYRNASEVSANIGLVGAVLMGALGLVFNKILFICIALFGGTTCWIERKRARGESDLAMGSLATGERRPAGADLDDEELFDPGPTRRAMKRMEAEQREREEVDRILERIAREGMDALSARERKALERATKARQRANEARAQQTR